MMRAMTVVAKKVEPVAITTGTKQVPAVVWLDKSAEENKTELFIHIH